MPTNRLTTRQRRRALLLSAVAADDDRSHELRHPNDYIVDDHNDHPSGGSLRFVHVFRWLD
jgi:hypothetical protein